MITNFIITIILLIICYQLIIGCYLFLKRQKYRQILRIERTRSNFAENRNQLISLAKNNVIDVNSDTFKVLYLIDTHIMRRTDQYPEISARLRRTFLFKPPTNDSNTLINEAKEWPTETKKLFEQYAEALHSLMIDYSWKIRFALWLEKNLKLFSSFSKWIEKQERKKNPFVKDIDQAQKSIHKLCSVG